MAFITKEQIAEMRKQITTKYPTKAGWKFSITRDDYTGVICVVVKSPLQLIEDGSHVTFRIGCELCKQFKELADIAQICNRGNYNKSDSMRDYFEIGWFTWLSVGAWNKPFKRSV